MKTSLLIEFPTPEAALEWWDLQVAAGLMPDDSEPFAADAIDMGGRARPGHYVIRDTGQRREQSSLRRLVEARRPEENDR